MPGKPSALVSPWPKGETGPRTEDRTVIFSGPDRMLALGGGKNAPCLPDAVLSLNLDLISSFIQQKQIRSTYCVLVHLIGSGEEIHTYIFLCQFLVHFKITIGPSEPSS